MTTLAAFYCKDFDLNACTSSFFKGSPVASSSMASTSFSQKPNNTHS